MLRQLCRRFATFSSTTQAAEKLRNAYDVAALPQTLSPPRTAKVKSAKLTRTATATKKPLPFPSAEAAQALQLLRDSPPYYALIEIKGRPYHIAKGDLIITNRLKNVPLGSILQLDCIRKFGSSAVYVDGDPYVSTKLADVKAVVIEHWRAKRQVIFKKKRRKGYERTLEHRQLLTSLRITECECNEPLTLLESFPLT